MKNRVVIAMSGGVDSSVAAALLQRKGLEVIGLTMCLNLSSARRKRPGCCSPDGIEDARRVARKLGIRHYVLNYSRLLETKVIREFCREYACGRTPNPCVRCNQYLKFDALLKKALSLGADFLATGHYARVTGSRVTDAQPKKYLLKKAKDPKKDQSYFLYRLSQKQLRHVLFPLGDYTKEAVRRLAAEFALPVAGNLASQEICFLPETKYQRFLQKRIPGMIKPGLVVDKSGNILGRHRGIPFYTIGQRQGLGIAQGYPLYIIKIDPQHNRITVGPKEDAFSRRFLVKDLNFIVQPIKKKVAVRVKIRYNHQEARADLLPSAKKIEVSFKVPQFAVTPGQSAVFYDRDTVLGGGFIDSAIE